MCLGDDGRRYGPLFPTLELEPIGTDTVMHCRIRKILIQWHSCEQVETESRLRERITWLLITASTVIINVAICSYAISEIAHF